MEENPLEQLTQDVAKKAARKERARQSQKRGIWSGLGMFGLVGWSVAVPTVIGVAIGVWLDRHYLGSVSWTLSLLIIGMALGCINAWHWIKQESKHD